MWPLLFWRQRAVALVPAHGGPQHHRRRGAAHKQAQGRLLALEALEDRRLLNVDPVVHIDPPGGFLDPSFGTGGMVTTLPMGQEHGEANDLAIQADGKIVVAGASYKAYRYQFALARYNPDGSLDTSFGGDGTLTTLIGPSYDWANSIAIQADGKIVVAGLSSTGSEFHIALARYNPDGSLDTSFDGDGKLTTSFGDGYSAYAESIAIQADGKIVVAGRSYPAGGGPGCVFALARYNPDGSLDTSFDGDGKLTTSWGSGFDSAHSVAIQADGKIVAAGNSSNMFALARYNPDGSLDTSFHGDGKVTTSFGSLPEVRAVAIQADGKIVVAGFCLNDGSSDFALARYNPDGSLDTSFDGDGRLTTAIGLGQDQAFDVVIQPDGKIVAAGNSYNGSAQVDFALARYNPDGSLDTGFGDDGTLTTAVGDGSYATALAIQADGKIVVAGVAYIGYGDRFALARYVDGLVDEGQTFTASGWFAGLDSSPWTATVDYGDGSGPRTLPLNADKTFALRHDYAASGTFTLTVTVSDHSGGVATGTCQVTVNNFAPTDILLSGCIIREHAAAETVVSNLASVDPGKGETFAYTLVDSAGGRFAISGSQLVVANGELLDLDTARTHTIRVRSTDSGGLSLERDLTITVTRNHGIACPGLYAPAGSTFFLKDSNGAGYADLKFVCEVPGVPWLPIAGDWDGDGDDTTGSYNPYTATFRLRNSNSSGCAEQTFVYGPSALGWLPVAGDWDGNGTDTIGLYDPRSGRFYLRNSNDSGYADLSFTYGPGDAGWRPVAGDWDGDGTSTVGLYDPRNSRFYLRNANSAGYADLTFAYGPAGLPSGQYWKPLAGDWDDDGQQTVGLYAPGSGMFYLTNSHSGGYADTAFRYGPPGLGWAAIVGDWTGPGGRALEAADGLRAPGAGIAPLGAADLQSIAAAAVAGWAAAGLPAESLAALDGVQLVITDLAGAKLAMVYQDVIYVDRDAAGHAWFVDPTPTRDEEFAAQGAGGQLRAMDPRAVDRVDLLSVVEHELGHVLGLDDLDPIEQSLMSRSLATGVRRLARAPQSEAIFGTGKPDSWRVGA